MVFLLFTGTRLRRSRWAFWQRRAADVFAWLPDETIDKARARAKADMSKRGWSIDTFVHSRLVDDDFPRANANVRANIWRASLGKPVYNFYAASRRSTTADAEEPGVIQSRYLDCPEVRIDTTRVPAPLHPLFRFAKDWAIMDDVERSAFIADAPIDQKKAFVAAVAPYFSDIEVYARSHEGSEPVPDEVIVLNLLAEAADIASHDVNG